MCEWSIISKSDLEDNKIKSSAQSFKGPLSQLTMGTEKPFYVRTLILLEYIYLKYF